MPLAPYAEYASIHGIHFEFGDLAVGLQQAHFVNEAALVVFKLYFQDLALELTLDLVKHRAQRQHLAGLQSLACEFVVAFIGMGLWPALQSAGPQSRAQRQAAQQGQQMAASQ